MEGTNNYEAAKNFTCLCVLSSEEQVHKLSKITQKMKTLECSHKVVKTTYEKFIEDKKQDTYNCVMFVMLEDDLSADDLEMQQDHFDYYATVPIVQWAISQKINDATEAMEGIQKFIKTNMKAGLVNDSPVVFTGDVEKDAPSMIEALDAMKEAYNQKIDTDVKPAFQKFDADGSGAIDKKELQTLSETLGFPLTDEQTDVALKDLDLNKDGVIDFNEFQRWYFTGMKSYNGKTRNMLKLGNKSKSILAMLKGQEIYDMIHENKKLSKHRVHVSFNAPEEVHYTEFKLSLFGENTANIAKEGQAFRDSLGAEYAPTDEPDCEYADVFAELNISMKSGNKEKYEKFISNYQALLDSMVPPGMNVHVKLSSTDDKMTAKLFIHQTKSNLQVPPIPDNLRDALKDIDQHVTAKVVLGIDAEEILTSDKPLLEQAMKGFSATTHVCFLKDIKKAIAKEFEGQENQISQIFGMAGPAFGVSSNTSMELEYDDFESIKDHPMAGQLLMSLDQLTTGMMQKSVAEVREFKESMGDDFDQAKFDEYVKSDAGDYAKSKQDRNKMFSDVLEFLGDINQTCDIQFKAQIDGAVSVNYNLHGAGYGDLCAFVFQMATFEMRQNAADRMISDFKESQAPAIEWA